VEKPEQWEKIKELFGAALERAPGQRAAFLYDACGRNESLRAEVESLLSAHARSDGLSELPWASPLLDGARDLKSIGPYHLQRKLGEGGMGQVWLAEQTAPIQRQVALKLIKAGMYDDSVLQRFQSERQSLAIMDHPSIAKVFDAGATPDGQPYFVMEYVPGLPITDYCDKKQLKIGERLELFIKACEGVQHAHQKAIIHRDLKPANILVQEVDGEPLPRIIDFGLAKAVAPHIAGETLLTHVGGFVGTPGYMSPEQADPGAPDVDTRTDVYSLGAVLYVLLTGSLPFDSKQRQKQPLDEVLRQLREDDPPRPSTKIDLKEESSTATAEMRGTAPKQLVSLLRGDLDWITMKALEKDRARRYGTPSELAADVRHYLRNEPVVARPASTGYRLRKYIRRHRLGVAAAGVISALLMTFAVAQLMQLRRTTRERDRADRITQFMTGMFKVSDPSETVGNTVTARAILDKASKDIDTGLAKDPELQARMMHVMGKAYENLGLYPRAQSLFERSASLSRGTLGPANPETLSATSDLAWTLFQQGHPAEAEKLQRETLDVQRRVLGPEHRDTLGTMGGLAAILADEGHNDEALRLQRETLAIERRVFGAQDPDTLSAMDNLAATLARGGNFAEAEKLERETLEIQLRVFGPENLGTLSSMINLAAMLAAMGRDAESETLMRQSLDIERRILGPDQPETALTAYNLACIVARKGQRDEALSLLSEAVDHGLAPRIDLRIDQDSDLNSLHGDPRFVALVAHAKQRAAAAAHPATP
jgi:serine/threonine protein kinase/tetratricopeptide (TPR) repeat protein